MRRFFFLAAIAAVAACSRPLEAPETQPVTSPQVYAAADDGTYLALIDPLGGQWRVERIGAEDFTRFEAWAHFSAGGFLNHGAGCRGGYPAFYRIDGDRLTVTRREPIRTGNCQNSVVGDSAAAADSERRLARFVDQIATWSLRDERTLVLVSGDGTRAVLTRPVEPYPDLAGRWVIESIGGEPLVTEHRPPSLSIAMNTISAHADCNSIGGSFEIPGPGRIVVGGPLISTQIGCAAEDAAEDALIARAMTGATGYRHEGARLVFTGGAGMVLHRPPAPNRLLAGSYEACGNTLLHAYHEGPVTLQIDEGVMRDNAGCTANYTAEGPRLTLRLANEPACIGPSPHVMPGEPIGIGGEISLLAVAEPDGFGFNDQGQLVLRTDRGLLTMCRKG